MMLKEKIKSFTDLIAWQKAHKTVLKVYSLTKNFPHEERFGLIDQMRRASISISSNIAEGFSRKSNLEKRQFYFLALGSLTEMQNQLLVARDVGYITSKEFSDVAESTIELSRLVNSLIKYIKQNT